MFDIGDYVKLVVISEQLCEDTGYERRELTGNFYVADISSSLGISFPYYIEKEDKEDIAIWVGKDEIEYA